MWTSKWFYLSAELKASLETDDDLVFPTLPVWDRLPFAEGVSSGISPKPYKKGSVIKVLKLVKWKNVYNGIFIAVIVDLLWLKAF